MYLNNASAGPIPEPARERVCQIAKKSAFEGEVVYDFLKPEVENLRKSIAKFFECSPDEIALCKNTSHGIILALYSIPFKNGDNVLIQKDAFPAIRVPVKSILRDVEVREVNLFKKNPIKELEKYRDRKTKSLIIDWVHFYKGYVLPLEEIGRWTRKNRIFFIVDGIQGAGAIPISLKDLSVDFFISGAAKWLCGSQGIGFIYARKEIHNKLEEKYLGWLSLEWRDFHHSFKRLPKRRKGIATLEEGTYNSFGVFAFSESMKILLEQGKNKIYRRIKELVFKLREILEDKEYKILTPYTNEPSGIVSFYPNLSCSPRHKAGQKLYQTLSKNRVIVSLRGENCIRVSPHFYNSIDEIEQMGEYL